MGFRYRKSIKLAPGVRMTISGSGISSSIGGRGGRLTANTRGQLRGSASVPGTGFGYSSSLGSSRRRPQAKAVTAPGPSTPPVPSAPGAFAPRGEKAMYKAVIAKNWDALRTVIDRYQDYAPLAAAVLGMQKILREEDHDEATRLLTSAFTSGKDPAAHPFAQKYLRTRLIVDIAPGVSIDLPINRDAVALVLAELHQQRGEIETAIGIVAQLEPTTYAAVSLAELYSEAGRYADVIDVTEGLLNEDDATALLCAFRGAAFREMGRFIAARETFKEALKSKKRSPAVRHRALIERARVHLAEGDRGRARTDLERVLAEDSKYDGLEDLLAEVTD